MPYKNSNQGAMPWHLKAALPEKVQVAKSKNEKLRQATFVIMKPGVDEHGDEVTAEDIRIAKESFLKSEQRMNLFHAFMTNSFSIIESYQTFTDIYLDDLDVFVEKGSWLGTFQIHTDELWALIESGEINGVSIGAKARVEILEEDE